MLQLSPVPPPVPRLIERLHAGAGRRALAIALALLIELLLLLMLWSIHSEKRPGKEEGSLTIVDLKADAAPEETTQPASPEPEQRERPVPQPPAAEQPQPAEPIPPPPIPPPPEQPPAIAINPIRPAPPRRVYGPPNTGAPAASSFADTEVVGTATNGEPLYKAEWYVRPRQDMLGHYLSTANAPGWGLIECRTAPGWRVEDCVGLGEYPRGSQIMRAVLAMAWEFKVRPPRLGGKLLVGSWVQIRIDYEITRK